MLQPLRTFRWGLITLFSGLLFAQNSGPADVNGFDGISWGTKYTDVKERLRVLQNSAGAQAGDSITIVADSEDREILIQRNGIYYRYVFYKKPVMGSNTGVAESVSRFFFVESIFPLVRSEDLYGKLREKYGEKSFSNLNKENRGANVWEKNEGFMVQWLEPYENTAYTRSLYYISKNIRSEIQKDLQDYQFQIELRTVQNLLP